VLREAARYLAKHGIESPGPTAEALLQHVLRSDRAGIYARHQGLSVVEARAFSRALCRRCMGVPTQYITGEQQFREVLLATEPGVFVPRPETEVLVDAALEVLDGTATPVVVDVGTGTGAVALSIKYSRADARVLATDVSPVAVTLAQRNAARLRLQLEILEGSLLDPVPRDLQGAISLLVSNPPYVSREEYAELPKEVRAEPRGAVVGGTEVHGALAALAAQWLTPGGWLVVEIGADQGPTVRGMLLEHLEAVEVLPDMAGRDRIVRGRLPVTSGHLKGRDGVVAPRRGRSRQAGDPA
jgi:release factor glutamine methyltransferase